MRDGALTPGPGARNVHQLFKFTDLKKDAEKAKNNSMNVADRAAGAVMGALIGDALGIGPHWYYDLTELRKDYGDWITGYSDPKPGRYHAGMKAGQLSQTGLILVMLLRSVLEKDGYQEEDFTQRLDRELLPYLNGTPMHGPSSKSSVGVGPEDMPIQRRLRKEPSFWLPATRPILEKLPRRSRPIAC
jgi:hypothetical protein